VMTSLLALAAVSMFSRQFLKLWKINKLLDKWILTLAGTAVAGIGLAVVVPYGLSARFTNFFVPVLSVSLVVAGVLSHARGVLQSKIFLFAWLAVILGTIVEFVSKLGFAPMNVPGRYAIQMGTLVEIILFSIALGRRIRTLTLEKATTENRLNQIEKDMQLRLKALWRSGRRRYGPRCGGGA
ncbi:MAG: 7TM-DISM domain-containing protein, partial [Spirochaetia bacterium]|nr:7TM-DISM domain-containing protein [Spirochaetia bacterium]